MVGTNVARVIGNLGLDSSLRKPMQLLIQRGRSPKARNRRQRSNGNHYACTNMFWCMLNISVLQSRLRLSYTTHAITSLVCKLVTGKLIVYTKQKQVSYDPLPPAFICENPFYSCFPNRAFYNTDIWVHNHCLYLPNSHLLTASSTKLMWNPSYDSVIEEECGVIYVPKTS